MNSYRLILIFFVFFLRAISSEVMGQCSVTVDDKGNLLKYSKGCAPIDPEWEVIYYGLSDGANVIVDWGDGDQDVMAAPAGDFRETFTHTYPKDQGTCTYEVTTFVEKDGAVCQETLQTQTITVWDTDNPLNGKLDIAPDVYRVCYGTEARLRFTDVSEWNCFDPSETATLNEAPRWIQWEYGTGDAATRIPGVLVNGSPVVFPFKNNPPLYPVTAPGEVSEEIYVPATTTIADVGKVFEVTLRNWNQCNPYDADLSNGPFNPVNGDFDNGDSAYVETTAYIVIVEGPEAEFVPRAASGAPEKTEFCPDETVYLDNMTAVHGGSVEYSWRFYEISTGNEVTPDLEDPNSSDKTTSFSMPGEYRIVLEATDTEAEGACVSTHSDTIEIIATPIAAMKVYDQTNTEITDLKFCESTTASPITIHNETIEPSGASVDYSWVLEKVNPADPSDVSFLLSETSTVMTFNYFSQPGLYRATLTASDNITGCDNSEVLYLEIHNTPKAEFQVSSSTELCVGREVLLEDLSESFTTTDSRFAEDTIQTWNWYIDGSLLASVDTAGLRHVFPNVRDYNLDLEVISASGCSDTYSVTLTVNPVPVAAFTLSPDEVCAGQPVTFTNEVIGAQPPEVNVNKYTWYVYDIASGTLVHQHDQGPAESTYQYGFTYERTDNTPQLFSVYLAAFDDKGCSTLSDADTVTVHPGVQARFHAQNYDPLASNCETLSVDFEVDQATQDLPFSKEYRWRVYDEDTTLLYDSGSVPDLTLTHVFENHDSTSFKEFIVTLEVIPANPVGCISPFSMKIRVNPKPSAKFEATTTLDCEYLLLDLDAYQKGLKVTDYVWAVTGGTADNSPVLDDAFTLNFPRKSTPYFIEVNLETTNFAGCSNHWDLPDPVLIPALENVEASFSYAPDGSCVPVTGTFTNTSTPGAVYELWIARGSSPPVAVTPGGDLAGVFTYEFTDPGEYSVTLKVTKGGCVDDSTKTVTIAPNPTADFVTSVAEACSGEYITFTDRSTANGSTITGKEWTITNLTSAAVVYGPSLEAKTNHQFINATGTVEEYEIALKVSTAEGCMDTVSRKVTIYPEPKLDFELASGDGCSYIFTFDNISGNDPGVQYIWNWGDGDKDTVSNEGSMTHQYVNRNVFQGTDTYFVTLEVIGANGCRKVSAPIQVELNPEVSANLLPDATKGCAPLTVNFDDFSMADPAITWEYKKIFPVEDPVYTTFPGDDFRATRTFENTSSDSVIYRVRNIATGTGGCTAMDSTDITVYPQIIADFSFTTLESCSPVEITFDNHSIKDRVQYVWSWGDGTENDTTYSEATIDHLFENTSFTNSRDYRVRLTARDTVTGCNEFMEKTVTVYPAILADIRSDKTEGCAPLDVQFQNFSLGAVAHEWFYINRTTGAKVAGSDLVSPNAFYTFENTTEDSIIYDVVYQGTKGSCGAYDTLSIIVYPELTAKFTASPERQNLPASTVTVTNETRDGATYEYLWDFGDGMGTSTLRNPAPYVYATYGTYIITLTVNDEYGRCQSTIADTVLIQPTIPVVDFDYAPESGCSPLTVQFTNKSKFADKNSYRWDFGDNSNSYSTEENPSYTYYHPGTYTVTLTASNEIGFTVTETKVNIIIVYDNPRALFQLRFYEVALHEEIQIKNRSIGADSYYWDFGDGYTSREVEPTHTYDHPGEFDITLVVTSVDGCADTLKMEGGIKASSAFDIDVPNAFAPHGSIGENAVFLPQINKAVNQYNLLIYNRWGELLFESKNREIGWDGYYRGQLSPQDVYIYKLKVTFSDGEETVRVGDVTLIR